MFSLSIKLNKPFQLVKYDLRKLNRSSTAFNNKINDCYLVKLNKNTKINQIKNQNVLLNVKHFYSTNSSNKRPLQLMDLPRILVPNFFELIKVRFKIKFGMMKIDPSFNYNEFSGGTLQAACTVSGMISRGDFDSLNSLVSVETVEKIQSNYLQLNDEQKRLIAINQADVQLQVAYNFETVEDTRQFAKICLLFYVVPGFQEALSKIAIDPTLSPELRRKFEQDLIIADYRFVREYTKGSESNWFISELNHWAISDYKEEFKR